MKRKLPNIQKGIRELYLDKVKGILSEQDYLDLSKDFVTQKERLENWWLIRKNSLIRLKENGRR